MATSKLFTVAGVSTQNGEAKIRFATDVMRIKVLAKNGHEDIQLVELPSEMTKVDAAKFIRGIDEFAGVAAQSAIADYLDKYDAESKPAKKAVAKTAVKAPAKAKAKAKAAVTAEAEDAPF
jgi:hypothetical protein